MAGSNLRDLRNVLTRKRVYEPGELDTSRLRRLLPVPNGVTFGNLRRQRRHSLIFIHSRQRDFRYVVQAFDVISRCLNQWDITALGLGSSLGVGMYVLIGSVALQTAGPAIVLSFIVAAVAALFAGLCYAEFSARIPRAGSAYIFTYVAIGELAAYIIGWLMILEIIFGAASVARGLSLHIDGLLNNAMSNWFNTTVPIQATFLSTHFDLFAFLVVIALGGLMIFGVRESSIANSAFTVISICTILFAIIAGAFKADVSNWYISESVVPIGFGNGGFFPYGIWGMLKGAAICFYGFVGFDVISFTGEEVREPRRSIPIAIVITISTAALLYCGVAIVVTMMVPYFLQENMSSVSTVFTQVGMNWASWIISVGAIFGILGSLFGALFSLPRLVYSMASDGLLFHFLAQINRRSKTPVAASSVSIAVIAVLSSIMELKQLVLMLCVGTLLSYTTIAASVILLRYATDSELLGQRSYLRQILGCGEWKIPTVVSYSIVCVTTFLYVCVCIALALLMAHLENKLMPIAVCHVVPLLLIIIIAIQPAPKQYMDFKTPLVPLIPCLSIYMNVHLLVHISAGTWLRVLIWALIGVPLYSMCLCLYNKHRSAESLKTIIHANGKPHVTIMVESPTPPDTLRIMNDVQMRELEPESHVTHKINDIRKSSIIIEEEIFVQQAVIDHNEEKEAKIIDLLDQVIQEEEDTYGEVVSLNDCKPDEVVESPPSPIPHRKSYSELSDAGSDASLSNTVQSKYDVVAQVHREDMPKVNEEDSDDLDSEKQADDHMMEPKELDTQFQENTENFDEHEKVTFFNISETDSRADEKESGYSDTIDDEVEADVPRIPTPPPMDENYFANPINPVIFKSHTTPNRSNKSKLDETEETKPRVSVQSNGSYDNNNIIFGSAKQMSFMSKLNNIFQTKISNNPEEGKRQRSHSTGSIVDSTELEINRERPPIYFDLKKELLARDNSNLRPVNIEHQEMISDDDESRKDELNVGTGVDLSLSREDLKSKLENIFATGGPKPFKSLVKSNPPTPEEPHQAGNSSPESVTKLPKIEKNDTLKRQKAIFGEVLNSFRLSLNNDDPV